MKTPTENRWKRALRPIGRNAVCLVIVVCFATGCSRTMTLVQGEYINTAMQLDRPAPQRTGEPLELDIVCVTSKDLKNQANVRLGPGSSITSDEWFKNRPKDGDSAKTPDRGSRFWVPKSQVHLLTNDRTAYGKEPLAGALRGSKTDGWSERTLEMPKSGSAWHSCAVLWIFPKFIGNDGKVLPVPPLRLDSPGAFTGELRVKVWSEPDDNPPCHGQRIGLETGKAN